MQHWQDYYSQLAQMSLQNNGAKVSANGAATYEAKVFNQSLQSALSKF